MARARNLKPGFFKNEDLAECSLAARLCFAGLWTLADREGRLEDRPKRVKAELFPFDAFEVEPLLCELATRGFILRYEADGVRAIHIPKFVDHQSPHYSEKASVIKPPPLQEQPGSAPGVDASSRGGCNDLNPSSLNPSSLNPSIAEPAGSAAAPRSVKSRRDESKTAATWTAYAGAFCARYGTDPVRNGRVNGQLSGLVDRLGAEEAPPVATYYVQSEEPYYVQRAHSVDALVRDAEKLRTLWKTGRASKGKHTGFAGKDYRAGVEDDGSIAA